MNYSLFIVRGHFRHFFRVARVEVESFRQNDSTRPFRRSTEAKERSSEDV